MGPLELEWLGLWAVPGPLASHPGLVGRCVPEPSPSDPWVNPEWPSWGAFALMLQPQQQTLIILLEGCSSPPPFPSSYGGGGGGGAHTQWFYFSVKSSCLRLCQGPEVDEKHSEDFQHQLFKAQSLSCEVTEHY